MHEDVEEHELQQEIDKVRKEKPDAAFFRCLDLEREPGGQVEIKGETDQVGAWKGDIGIEEKQEEIIGEILQNDRAEADKGETQDFVPSRSGSEKSVEMFDDTHWRIGMSRQRY